jgi:phage terminase small subunit
MVISGFTGLTNKQRLYAQSVAQGKSKQEAKRIAGYSATTSTTLIESPSVKAAFSRLVRQFTPAHVLARVIAEGVEAHETKFFQHEGKVTDSKDVIAWGPRATFAKLAAEYGGYVETETQAQVNTAIQVNVKFIGEKDEK